LKSNQGSARVRNRRREREQVDQPTEINTTRARVIILELLARALLAAAVVNERRTKMAIRISHRAPVFRLNIAGRERERERELSCAGGNQFLQLRSIFNYSSAHQLYCTHWRAHRSKKSPTRCAHTVLLMSRICFHFFCCRGCRLLLTKVAILNTISGSSPTACWHLSD
jgi:hypothetical protein